MQVLDSMAGEAQGPALASLLCNRALCYQKMDLHRKALKVRAYRPLALLLTAQLYTEGDSGAELRRGS